MLVSGASGKGTGNMLVNKEDGDAINDVMLVIVAAINLPQYQKRFVLVSGAERRGREERQMDGYW